MSLCDAGRVCFIIFESITVTAFAKATHNFEDNHQCSLKHKLETPFF